jgi:hypothetical protein
MKAKVAFFGLALMLASHTFAETFSADGMNHRVIERRAIEPQ